MPSFRLSAAVLATAIFFMNTQAQYTIDPNSVPLATRQSWCQSQVASCPLLCLQNQGQSDATTSENDCDATSLTYNCICGNGLTPSLANYSQTIPYFECTEFGSQCIAACNNDQTCQSACRANNPCGAQNPTRVNTTTSSSMPSTTEVPAGATSGPNGVVYTGLGGGSAATPTSSSTKKSGSDMALDLGRSYGLAVVFTGLLAGFALVM